MFLKCDVTQLQLFNLREIGAMRYLLVILFFSLTSKAFSQIENTPNPASNEPTIPYGYIGQTRLDSLPGSYGEVELRGTFGASRLSMIFRYYDSRYDQFVFNKEGNEILFSNWATALSFLQRNGWTYVNNINVVNRSVVLVKKGR